MTDKVKQRPIYSTALRILTSIVIVAFLIFIIIQNITHETGEQIYFHYSLTNGLDSNMSMPYAFLYMLIILCTCMSMLAVAYYIRLIWFLYDITVEFNEECRDGKHLNSDGTKCGEIEKPRAWSLFVANMVVCIGALIISGMYVMCVGHDVITFNDGIVFDGPVLIIILEIIGLLTALVSLMALFIYLKKLNVPYVFVKVFDTIMKLR